ncbi:MAG TPA: hypothetical protein DC047_05350 [Blastocatellia bacterium]|nr:hypothetical protein [Blastocatellia bacterium]
MLEQGDTAIEDRSLDAELDNREAVAALMALYNVDESTAKELWKRFIDTVKKTKAAADEKESAIAQS